MVGQHNRTGSDDDHPFRQAVRVIANDWHREFDANGNLEKDIAILTLAEDLTFNDGVQPICNPSDSHEDYDTLTTHVSGWGTTSSGGTFFLVFF